MKNNRIRALVRAVYATMASGLVLHPGPGFSEEVGALSGKFSVSNIGAAVYELPISVPPGIAGLKPNLAIIYTSSTANGALGAGFSVAGFSTVSRCPTTIAQDGFIDPIDLDSNDRFCLDGSRLIAVSGGYGAVGTSYRTELESFSRIQSVGGAPGNPAYWTVWTKSGLRMELGNSTSSRNDLASGGVALLWAVNKIADTNGNSMTIEWSEEATHAEAVPLSVDYTHGAGGLPGQNRVVFTYDQSRPDVDTTYVAGVPVKQVRRLVLIEAYAGTTVARRYGFEYDNLGAVGRSRLKAIGECAPVATGITCIEPTTFSWPTQPVQPGAPFTPTGISPSLPLNHACFAGDLDGDALTDTWCHGASGSSNWTVGLSRGGLWPQVVTWTGPTVPNPARQKCLTGDLDADGRTDMFCNSPGGTTSWKVVSYKGGATWTVEDWTGAVPQVDVSAHCFTGDLNGDARTDVWCNKGNGGGTSWLVMQSTGSGFNVLDWEAYTSSDNVNARCAPADLNGDGLADMICEFAQGSSTWKAAISNGSGWNTSLWENGPAPGGDVSARCFIGDVNADGMSDIVCNVPGLSLNWQVSMSTGKGFAPMQDWTGIRGRDPLGERCLPGDLNGDGRTDIWCENALGSDQWTAALSTGQGWDIRNWIGPDIGDTAGSRCFTGDANGDGAIDAWCGTSTSTWHGSLSSNVTDLVSAVTNGLGARIEIRYAPITRSGGPYAGHEGTASYPFRPLSAPIYVVSEHLASNGLGAGLNTVQYKYAGAKLDQSGRGFLGFSTRQVYDVAKNIRETTTFSQVFPFTGLITKQVTAIGATSGPVIGEKESTYQEKVLDGLSHFVFEERSIQRRWETEGVNRVVTSAVTVNEYWDLPYLATFFGNLRKSTISTFAGHEASGTIPFVTVNQNDYTDNSGSWILGRLVRSSVTKSGMGLTPGTRTSAFGRVVRALWTPSGRSWGLPKYAPTLSTN